MSRTIKVWCCVLLALPGATLGEAATVQLDEISVVGANHRAEPAQHVPASIQAIDGDRLGDAGLDELSALAQRVPGVMMNAPNPRYTAIGIRGLGSSSANDGLDGSVAVFLDGVYLARQGMTPLDFADIERVEILRGPQATLYGKNATAGAINLTSRMPSFTNEGQGEIRLGQDGLRHYRASVSGPLIDDELAARLSLFDVSRDGDVDNLFNGARLNDEGRQGFRGQLLWIPNERFSARLIGEYAVQDESAVLTASNLSTTTRQRAAFVGYQPLPVSPYARRVEQNDANSLHTLQRGLTLQLDNYLDNDLTLTSITGYRDWSYGSRHDADSMALSVARSKVGLDHSQFSQELRLAQSVSEQFDYLLGVYYLQQRLQRDVDVAFGRDAAAFFLGDRPEINALGITPGMVPSSLLQGAEQHFSGGQDSDTQALFGQFTWRPTERLAITPGLRFSRERKRGEINRVVDGLTPLGFDPVSQIGGQLLRSIALGGAYARSNRIQENNLSGQLALSYQFSDEVVGYARWSRGYKAGGINLEVTGDEVAPVFDAERATAVEVGIKSRWWDDRVLLDVALYQTDVDDYQALSNSEPVDELSPPLRDNLINVGKVRLRGVEVDARLQLTPRVGWRLGLALSDARYRSFDNAPCAPQSAALSCDLSGKQLFNAPRWSVSTGLAYHQPLFSGLELFGALDYDWRSGYYGVLERGAGSYQSPYGLTHVRVGMGQVDQRWAVELWAQNLFDQDYASAFYATLGSGDYGLLPGTPRSLGMTLRGRY